MHKAGKVVVLGAGGHAKVVVSTLRAAGWEVVAILDDRKQARGSQLHGVPIKGEIFEAVSFGCPAVIAIGNNHDRQRVATEFSLDWASAIHPLASVDPSVRLGPGTVVFAGSIIQPDTEVGQHAILNTAVSVDHDCFIGDFAHLAPGVRLAGGVRIGDGALIGIGGTVSVGVQVGPWSTVGAGAVVIRPVTPGSVVVGVPARPISSSS
jgi:UDP-perosamine 4-acetyltransferase